MTTKRELVARVAALTGYPKTHVAEVFGALLSELSNVIIDEGRLELRGFGVWRVVELEARAGRNPQTGEAVSIEASKHVRFKAGKQLREELNATPIIIDE